MPRNPQLPSSTLYKCLVEVTERITSLAGRTEPLRVDDSGMGRLRTVNAPTQRKAVAAGYSFTSGPRSTCLAIWDYIWRQSDLMEVRNQALYFYQHKTLTRPEVTRIRAWMDRCSCWEHCDDLAKIYADVVEQRPDWVVPTLKRWNRSRNPWKRRQSVVALVEYASKRRRFLSFGTMIAQVESLLDDEDYYVQKGLG